MTSDRKKQLASLDKLLTIMDELREKCPWDQKQTFESLRHLTIEETYELGDAILDKDLEGIKGELGDLLLHIVFYSKIASETNDFDISDVAEAISKKLIFRHPHVYGDVSVTDEETVKKNWEKLKLKEGKKSVFDGVPKSLPALVKASRIQDKAAGVGFDWKQIEDVKSKLDEELNELHSEVMTGSLARQEAEFGDVLFSMINYARFLGINAEDALERTNKKFLKRFHFMENQVHKKGKTIDELSLEEMESLWQLSKTKS
jgi:XTP/dITP diphosphohydrolase